MPERPEGDDDGRYSALRGIDADGDGRDDEVVLWRSYSESRFPGDLQEVAYTPSASGTTTYKASFPRIAVLRRGDSYYVQGLSYEVPQLPKSGIVQVDVLQLRRDGLLAICTKRDPWVGND